MAYIGNNVTVQQYAPTIASFTGNGTATSFTLPSAVVSSAQVLVHVNNVAQNPSYAFSVSGNVLTFTSAPPANSTTPVNIWVEYTSLQTNLIAPSTGTVTTGSLSPGFVLPVANGGTGSSSFGSTGSGVVVLQGSPTINTPSLTTPSMTTPTISSGSILNSNGRPMAAQTGGVLQVIQVTKTDAMAAVAGAVWANVPGQGGSGSFQATITPSSTSSKILIIVDMKGAGVAGNSVIRSRLIRGSTPIYYGDANGSNTQGIGQFYCTDSASGAYYLAQLGGSYLDSPSTTSATTYTMQYGSDGNSNTSYINRTQGNRGTGYDDVVCAASITLMEIAG